MWGQGLQKASAFNFVIAKSEADTGIPERVFFLNLCEVNIIKHSLTLHRGGVVRTELQPTHRVHRVPDTVFKCFPYSSSFNLHDNPTKKLVGLLPTEYNFLLSITSFFNRGN